MKRTIFLSIVVMLSTIYLWAQEPSHDFAQPKNIIGRKINASGEVTKEYNGAFEYLSDGTLERFLFSDWRVSSSYIYEDHFLTDILTLHEGMPPYYDEAVRYTYEAGRVKLESHEWSGMNENEYVEYSYYDDGRLYKKGYSNYHPEDFYGYSTFEYENGGKTRIETYSNKALQGLEVVWKPKYRTTSQYDDKYALISEQTDKYNENGEITSCTRHFYTYTLNGNLDAEYLQTLIGNNWANSNIHRYIYDDNGSVLEQQFGVWSDELADWDINKKIVHGYSKESSVYTVTFYKKTGNEWKYDIFNEQTVFFDSDLSLQQRALTYFAYEDLFGSALINQFVFEMIYTKRPTYYSTEENDQKLYCVYPNPGKGIVTVTAPKENSIVRFYDLQGRLLLAKPFDFDTTIEADDWNQGIYLWEIWNGTNKEASGKWIKE